MQSGEIVLLSFLKGKASQWGDRFIEKQLAHGDFQRYGRVALCHPSYVHKIAKSEPGFQTLMEGSLNLKYRFLETFYIKFAYIS